MCCGTPALPCQQAAAEERVADGVGRVEAALRTKLGQVQLQTQSLSEALGSINTELAKLAHAQQRISSMQAHLQDKLVVNRGRQQVNMQQGVVGWMSMQDRMSRQLSPQLVTFTDATFP